MDVILEEFFELVEGVWIQHRVEHEIAQARKRITAAQENGKKGGRPRKKPTPPNSETQQKPSGLSVGSDSETQAKAHHLPSTNLPIGSIAAASTTATESREGDADPPPSPQSPDEAQARTTQIAVILRRGGACQRTTTPNNRAILAMAEKGYADVVILQALQTALQRRKDAGSNQPVTAAYLLPIIEELQTGPPARAGGRYAEDIRQMRELSAWADQQILEQRGATRPPAEIDMGAADAPRND